MVFRQRIDVEFGHRKILAVVGHKNEFMRYRGRRDQRIGQGQSFSSGLPFVLEQTGIACNFRRHRVSFQLGKKLFYPLFFS